MKKTRMLFILSISLSLFFTGNVLAADSHDNLSEEELNNQTSISFDGEEEKTSKTIFSTKQKERISFPYEGTGDMSDFNSVDEEQIDISKKYDHFSIIGEDDRTRVTSTTSFPYRAIVKLSTKHPNSNDTFGCTGFMVNEDTVVTAGHCVYKHDKGGWAEEITASPGRNGSSLPYGSFDWETVYTVSGWKDNKNPEYDYGAIKLRGTPGNNTGWFGYRTTNVDYPADLSVNVTGYPCDQPSGTMWTDSGKVLSVMTRQLGYNADTFGCQSGSPVYRNYSETGQTAIAIHAYGASGSPLTNKGTRITQAVFNNISTWKEE
ncbi:serine protease [Virgibacillus dokdonensis]|nr:serine protease [Virgibacillus dokdonensis]